MAIYGEYFPIIGFNGWDNMLASINTLVINGIEATPVKVEVDIQAGLPAFENSRFGIMDIKVDKR